MLIFCFAARGDISFFAAGEKGLFRGEVSVRRVQFDT
jgi:hypothetical protein